MSGFLLVNPRAGGGRPSTEELVEAARERGIETHVQRRGEDAAELARTEVAAVLGVAGGDGSLAPVAAVALERGLPFVCVPLGTRNHFARDLGIERDGALAAFGSGRRGRNDGRRIDARVLLVANNRYDLGPLELGARPRLDEGRLAVYIARGLLPRSWEMRETERVVIEQRGRLRAAVDGEPAEFDSPLEVAT